jgi:hypothetical protein
LLSFLLIISPIVLLFWVIPDLAGQFKKWWDKFLEWVFFAPASAFFIYLAVYSAKFLGDTNLIDQIKDQGTLAGSSLGDSIKITIAQGGQMIVLCGIMLGGLIVAQQMGIQGANLAMKLGSDARKKVQGWAKEKGTNAYRKAMTLGAKRDKEGKTYLEKAGAKLGKVPLLGRAATALSGLSTKAKTQMQKGVEDMLAELGNRTDDDVLNMAAGIGITPAPQKAAAFAIELAKRGKWDKLDARTQSRMLGAIKRTKSWDKFLVYRPDQAPKLDLGFTEENAFNRYVQDASKVDKTIFDPTKNPNAGDVIRALKPQHIAQLTNLNQNVKAGIVSQIQPAIDSILQLRAEVDGYTKAIEEARDELRIAQAKGDQAGIRIATQKLQTFQNDKKQSVANLQQAMRALGDQERNLLNVFDAIQQNAAWANAVPPLPPFTPTFTPTPPSPPSPPPSTPQSPFEYGNVNL